MTNTVNTVKRLFLNASKREQRQLLKWFHEMNQIMYPTPKVQPPATEFVTEHANSFDK